MKPFRVDLRSDTVTTPSPAMRRAMADAEVGDDWYGDDPTVNRLQERAAEITGKEAALYVPTGTMANQIALRLHVQGSGHLVASSSARARRHDRGDDVGGAVGDRVPHRGSGLPGLDRRRAGNGAARTRQLLRRRGWSTCSPSRTRPARPGARVLPIEEMRAIRKVADDAGVPVHLDGARLFNAAAAAGVDVVEWASEVDTIMFCVSKGLGAPIGSLVCGPAELMREARRLRILFGGAWRQAGITAAAGIVALREGPQRLHEDHERARRLADGVAEILPGAIDHAQVETNMVFVDTEAVGLPCSRRSNGSRPSGWASRTAVARIRMVTHLDIDDDGVAVALDAWRSIARDVAKEG